MTPFRTLVALLSTAAAAEAQQWVSLDSGPPSAWTGTVYDRAGGRFVVQGWRPNATFSFDGAAWRRHVPDGLETAAIYNGGGPLLMGYDEVSDRAIAVLRHSAATGAIDTWATHGAGWEPIVFNNAPAVYGAGVAVDPAGGGLFTFGGQDYYTGQATDLIYRWVGQTWVQVSPSGTWPAARTAHGLATDRARNRVVLFGGRDDNYQSLGDTWEWDGSQWLAGTPPVSPSPRSTALAWDPAAQRVVLLGGFDTNFYNDTWDWDGAAWTQRGQLPNYGGFPYEDGTALYLASAVQVWRASGNGWTPVWSRPGPGLRYRPALGYDPARGETLLVGGQPNGDTWTWNGSWQQHNVAGPSLRTRPVLAPLGGDMILFGGQDALASPFFAWFDETWRWNGQSWLQLQPTLRPSPRSSAAATTIGNEIVLFGGTGPLGALGDTWGFDGTTWTQKQPAVAPIARSEAGIAFDPLRQVAVLQGGVDAANQPLQDTWEWDGQTWTQVFPANAPPVGGGQMVFDSAVGQVAFARDDGVWYFDGTFWGQSQSYSYGIDIGAVAFDAARQRVIAFSELDLQLFTAIPARAMVFASSCGTRPDLRLFDRPAIGESPLVHVEGQPAAPAVLVYGLSVVNQSWAPGCSQQVSLDASAFVQLDAVGRADRPLAIPFDPALRGLSLGVQAVVLDGGPVFGASLSSGLWLTVGD
ncbi:MAG: hypothetical protein KDE27_14210 [Planctomycetes bacterium]|nr:hypothetical protein [Planctomycetota bacterium]